MTSADALSVADTAFAIGAVLDLGRQDVARRLAARLSGPGDDAAALRLALADAQDEIAALRDELARAKEAERKRVTRAKKPKAAPASSRPRVAAQQSMFERPAARAECPVENPDVRASAPDVPDTPPCMHASSSSIYWMTGNARASAPDADAEPYDDPDQPPQWVFDEGEARRPSLSEFDLRDLWRFIAKKPHTSEADARDHFVRTLPKHKVRDTGAPPSSRAAASADVVETSAGDDETVTAAERARRREIYERERKRREQLESAEYCGRPPTPSLASTEGRATGPPRRAPAVA